MTHRQGKWCRLTKSRWLHKSGFVASLVLCITLFAGAQTARSAETHHCIITGDLNLRRYLPGSPEGDGTVSMAETVVPGMLDFLVMPVTHTFIMWDGEVLRQVGLFLNNGRFDRSQEAGA